MIESKPDKDLRLLALGAFVGLIVAGSGILRQAPADRALPDGVIARVNDTLINRDQYDRTYAGSPGDAGESEDTLNTSVVRQLVDDELLVQRGIELGMMRSDLTVRQVIVESLIASITAEADAASPTDDELNVYLIANSDRFSYTARISLDAWQTDDEALAQEFISRLRADDTAGVNGDIHRMKDLPTGLMRIEVARDYIGPGIAAAVAAMPAGSSAVFARRGQWLVVRLRDREKTFVTDLNAIRNRVLIDYRRRLADEALETYLEDLRQRAKIDITPL